MGVAGLVLVLALVPLASGDTDGTYFYTFTDQSTLGDLQLITLSEHAHDSMKACSLECLGYSNCDVAIRNSTACYLFGITGLTFQPPLPAATPEGEENQLILKTPLCSLLKEYRYLSNVKLVEAVSSISNSLTVQNVNTEDECYQACKGLIADCQLFSYEKDTKNCTISSADFYDTWTHAEARDHTVSCFKHQSGRYKLLYRRPKYGKTGHTFELIEAWTDDIYNTPTVASNAAIDMTTTLGDLAKSSLVPFWSMLGIDRVRLGIYKDGSEAKFAEFDGVESTNTDWMSIDKLIDSSWTDLGVGQTYLYVAMTGINIDGRAPYLCRYHGGCPADELWFCGLEKPRPTGCDWEKTLSWNTTVLPRFLYSNLDVAVVTTSSDLLEADVMAYLVTFQ